MKLSELPELKDVDVAFSTIGADKKLLEEAREKGFYSGSTKYNDMFSSLFFSGGKIEVKKTISDQDKKKGLRYFKALASSFSPKHEEKEAICALILSELCD